MGALNGTVIMGRPLRVHHAHERVSVVRTRVEARGVASAVCVRDLTALRHVAGCGSCVRVPAARVLVSRSKSPAPCVAGASTWTATACIEQTR